MTLIHIPTLSGPSFLAPGSKPPSLVVLALLTGVSPWATDMYLAALPGMTVSLDTSSAIVQLTVTAFLVGLAGGQILLGAVADVWGRRRIVLVGSGAFAVLSLCCALAPNGPVLVALRLAQGVAGAAGVVCGRAVVGDHYRGSAAARRLGVLAAITSFGPIAAPGVGALLMTVGSWRTVFVALAVFGALTFLGALLRIPETLERDVAVGMVGPRTPWGRYRDLAGDSAYMRHVGVFASAVTGYFVYVGGSSFTLQIVYGISSMEYGVIFASNAVAMAAASFGYTVCVARMGSDRLRLIGLGAALVGAGAVVGACIVSAGPPPLLLVWPALAVVMAGMGLVYPASYVLAQAAGARSRGAASALVGGLAMACGAAMTPATGILGDTSVLPMAAAMMCFFAVSLALRRRRPARPSGRPRPPSGYAILR